MCFNFSAYIYLILYVRGCFFCFFVIVLEYLNICVLLTVRAKYVNFTTDIFDLYGFLYTE